VPVGVGSARTRFAGPLGSPDETPVAPGACPDFDGFGFGFEVLDGDSVLEVGPVDVGLLDVVVLLELVGLVDVVVLLELLELVVLLEEVDDSDVVDGAVVVVGTWLSPTPVRDGKSTVLVPSRAPLMKAVQILTGNVPPVSSPKPAMFCIGSGLPLTSL
jgi:hypothetical protein